MRYRVTVRGDHPPVELRGFVDADTIVRLHRFADAMEPYGLVIASEAEDDYWPWSEAQP
jgi:hypothetical protein